MRRNYKLSVAIGILTLFIASGPAFAQSDQGISARVFGQGQPQFIHDLPPGQLRNRLQSLPPQASSRALRWLQDFSFPGTDLDTLRIDDEGNVYYGDTILPDEVDEAATEASGPEEAAPQTTLTDAFLLHSKPLAPNTVYIDFTGHTISGTAWNGSVSVLQALPYNIEGDGSTFSDLERTRIVDIWHRVAEDLAPYDIDVTTQEPTAFNSHTGRILVTHSIDANGNAINCTSCGGVAYVGVFGSSNYAYYSPALVFFDKLGGGGETYVAEASSHEFGHNLGLSHDGTQSGTTYYAGHGAGLVSWAPIMGNSYNKNITTWSIGEYPDANQFQDDLAIIDGKLGYKTDDHGDTRALATALVVDSNGFVIGSNPEDDPHNVLPENKGVIGSETDVDVFSFVPGAGDVSLTVTPSWDAFYRSTSRRGANLDIEIELQNAAGEQVAYHEPNTDTGATITTNVPAGTYYLLVTGVGNLVTPYSDYGSLGHFYINGSMTPASPDVTAPSPNPMTWASEPAATSYQSMAMTANTATDDISTVEYNFQCVVGGQLCVNSGWQSSTAYTATGLAASTAYTWQVVARDQSNNETGASIQVTASTNPPPPPPLAPSGLSANGISETEIDLVWTDNASSETGYRLERSAANAGNFVLIADLGVNANSYSDSGLSASTTYDYRVSAYNDFGTSGFDTTSGTTNDPPPFTDFTATSDTAMAGSVGGGYTNTFTDNGSSQTITERESGGKPSKRHTYLEHRWNFNISSGVTVTVFANAWSGGSTDGDSFNFEYSTNGGNSFNHMFAVSTDDSTQMPEFEIPGAPSGAIILRVVDTDQSQGHREKNTVFIDQLFIQVGNPPSNPPDGDPSGMTATMVSSSQIDLSWTDGSTNEGGFKLERSADGSTGWEEIADLPVNAESHTDTGLAASTTYYYRVSAYNINGNSGYSTANATTDLPPPPPVAPTGLSATGVSTSQIDLSWSHNGTNEDGFRIERWDTGQGDWSVIDSVDADVYSFSDTGLPAATSFDYRVVAFNGSGDAASDIATGQTFTPPALSLSNNPYKVKGRHHVGLTWTGSNNVDVYRGTSLIAAGVEGSSFDDDIGAKGGATYTHKVCEAGATPPTCSNTTTSVF